MKLLIISNTSHYSSSDKTITGFEPTVRENEYICSYFSESLIMGVLHPGPVPAATASYSNKKIRFSPLEPSGGQSFISKLKTGITCLKYLFSIHKEVSRLASEDWIYIRCPCNIGLVACFYLMIFKKPNRWFKFAGNWQPEKTGPFSYALQRFFLKNNLCGGKVTINGKWPDQAPHILSLKNACLSKNEIKDAEPSTRQKNLNGTLNIIFVGRVEKQKGVFHIVDIAAGLSHSYPDFIIEIIGNGKDKERCKEYSIKQGQEKRIRFLGEMSKKDLLVHYAKSHIFLLPSATEGWPKVLSEAMAFRCVPLASHISSIPQILSETNAGISLSLQTDLWVKQILYWIKNPSDWRVFADNGNKASYKFTYEEVTETLSRELCWNRT